jgi:hypothetical protein
MIAYINAFILPAAFALLPPKMDTPEARAMLLTIGLQESRFSHRRQLGAGPARGFWQFELAGGVVGVLTHRVTKPIVERLLDALLYLPAASACYDALEHNDVLAAAFARLLLYTVPGPLPARFYSEKAWQLYVNGWRPGKPHRETWDAHFVRAWECVAPVEGFKE